MSNSGNLSASNVLKTIVTTEKSVRLTDKFKQFVFYVSKQATKIDVKKAVEELFSVKVKSVNILNLQGKTKSFRGREGRRPDRKKAYVTLYPEFDINLENIHK